MTRRLHIWFGRDVVYTSDSDYQSYATRWSILDSYKSHTVSLLWRWMDRSSMPSSSFVINFQENGTHSIEFGISPSQITIKYTPVVAKSLAFVYWAAYSFHEMLIILSCPWTVVLWETHQKFPKLKKKSSLTIAQIHVTSSSIVVFLFFLFISMLITSRGLIIGIYPLMFGLN